MLSWHGSCYIVYRECNMDQIEIRYDLLRKVDDSKVSTLGKEQLKNEIMNLRGTALQALFLLWHGMKKQRDIAEKLNISEARVSKIFHNDLERFGAILRFEALHSNEPIEIIVFEENEEEELPAYVGDEKKYREFWRRTNRDGDSPVGMTNSPYEPHKRTDKIIAEGLEAFWGDTGNY